MHGVRAKQRSETAGIRRAPDAVLTGSTEFVDRTQ